MKQNAPIRTPEEIIYCRRLISLLLWNMNGAVWCGNLIWRKISSWQVENFYSIVDWNLWIWLELCNKLITVETRNCDAKKRKNFLVRLRFFFGRLIGWKGGTCCDCWESHFFLGLVYNGIDSSSEKVMERTWQENNRARRSMRVTPTRHLIAMLCVYYLCRHASSDLDRSEEESAKRWTSLGYAREGGAGATTCMLHRVRRAVC